MQQLVASLTAPHWLTPVLLGTALTLGCTSDNKSGDADAVAGSSTSGGNAAASGAASSGGSAGSAGATNDVRGSLVVSLAAPVDDSPGYTTLIGRFFAGPTPDPAPLKLDTKLGDCELLVPVIPFCIEACSPGVCTADDKCTSYPAPLSVGALTVNGLGTELVLAPATSMVVYQSPSLPYPPCAEGTKVTASASGFALEADCVAPLTLTGPDPIPVKAGASVQVDWERPSVAGSSRIRIGLDLSHHGGKKGQIDCEVPDTGSFEIPEALVTKLVGLGLAGYPTINVNRVSVGVDASNPEVSLLLSSSLTRAVDTGVFSCQDDVECPAGQTCQIGGTCGMPPT